MPLLGSVSLSPWIEQRLWRVNQMLQIHLPPISHFAFIVGAMKAGTTTLYSYLTQHPELARNMYQKEPEFFSQDVMPVHLKPYFLQWSPLLKHRAIAIEASTGYTKLPNFPNAAERIAQLNQKKTIFYIVRDPIARIESHFAHNLAIGDWSKDQLRDPAVLDFMIAVSSYGMQLEAYERALPNTPIKVLDFESLCNNPAALLVDVCNFLGIDADFKFSALEAQNRRRTDNGADEFRIDDRLAGMLRERLAPDIAQFGRRWCFDIEQWGFRAPPYTVDDSASE